MTSFIFEGPAIGGPSNGRVLVSHQDTFVCLYPVQIDPGKITCVNIKTAHNGFGLFRYRAHTYGEHKFFLPAGETLEQFLQQWQPPIEQNHWPAFMNQAIEALNKDLA